MYRGWKRMSVVVEDKDLGYKEIVKEVKKLDGSYSDIGLFGSGGDASTNLAERGAVHEFGSKSGKIPARPFERKAFDGNIKEIKGFVSDEYNKMLERKIKAKHLLNRSGEFMEGLMKEEVTQGQFIALSPKTILAKGSSRPLIDTGDMRNAIQHKEKMKS